MNVILLPGLGNSGPDHWQSWWERRDSPSSASSNSSGTPLTARIGSPPWTPPASGDAACAAHSVQLGVPWSPAGRQHPQLRGRRR